MTNQAGQRRIFANRMNRTDIFQLSDGVRLGVQSRQVRFYPGIVDAQKLGCTSHHVNIKMLALGPLFVHELKYGIGWVGVLKNSTDDHEQGFSQMGRAALGDAAGLGVECAGLEGRRVHARESHQSALVCETPYVPDLCLGTPEGIGLQPGGAGQSAGREPLRGQQL